MWLRFSKKNGFGGTFFVCEYPGFEDKAVYCTWEQIASMDKMGFEIANHTLTHTGVNQASREQFKSELKTLEDRARTLGIPKMISFAYPGCGYNDMAVQVLAEEGYLFARTCANRPYDPAVDNPLMVPAYAGDGNRDRVLNAFRMATNGKIVVIIFHGVPDHRQEFTSCPLSVFEEYLKFLSDNKYTVIAMRDLAKYVQIKKA
jgi:peptidoglycan-N-acetylglucosamine deacetylase